MGWTCWCSLSLQSKLWGGYPGDILRMAYIENFHYIKTFTEIVNWNTKNARGRSLQKRQEWVTSVTINRYIKLTKQSVHRSFQTHILISFGRWQVSQDGGCVLVHCLAGRSRSAALVLAYLVKHLDLSLRSAFLHLRACRPAVRPNSGFFSQLIEFERQIRGSTSVSSYSPQVLDGLAVCLWSIT